MSLSTDANPTYKTQQAYDFHARVFRAPIRLAEGALPRPSSAIQGATRARREFPFEDPPQSRRTGLANSVTTMSSYSLVEWMQIQLLAEFSAA